MTVQNEQTENDKNHPDNKPLEGKIHGKWTTISIPKDHIMIFTGLTLSMETGVKALIHRVPKCDSDKFTIGVFVGASEKELVRVKNPTSITKSLKTIGNLNKIFFSGKFSQKEIEKTCA